ncbi:HEAT repeat domain-containing protein [Zavarzinella formosa]|uniref:HEAT repeat domain-containing protein n=1 Tax=Zavarzinella formosa TaxID=360055 RepID=UPI0002D3A7EA|nr:HEAT repeat domain-containing protein [Zavarzinella formosa]
MRPYAVHGVFFLLLVGCGKPAPKVMEPVAVPDAAGVPVEIAPEPPVIVPPKERVRPERPARKPATPPAVDELAALLVKLRQDDSRAEAATQIGKLGAKGVPAVPELMSILDDANPDVRKQAATAIVALGRQPVSGLLDFYATWCGPCRDMKPIVDKLEKEGLPIITIDIDKHPQLSEKFKVTAVPTYVALKADNSVGRTEGMMSEKGLRNLAAKAGPLPGAVARPGLGEPAAEAALMALVLGLDEEDAWTRFGAEAGLRSQPQVVSLLAPLADKKYPARIRCGAIQGFLVIGKDLPEEVRKSLAKSLADEKESVDVRGYSAIALGDGSEAKAASITPVLLTALGEGRSSDLRARAATRLGELRAKTAVPVLTKALGDQAEPVRLAAATSLGQLGAAAISAIPDLLAANAEDENKLYREALEQICRSGDATPALAKALGHETEAVRLLAIEMLSESADPSAAVKELEKALADKNLGIRVKAAMLLQQAGEHDKTILPVLIESLVNDQESGEATGALMGMGRRAVPELVKYVTNAERPDAGRLRAARALRNAKLSKSDATALKEALGSGNVRMRVCAALVLSRQMPSDEAVQAALIAGMAFKDREIRSESCQALGQTKSPAAITALLTALSGKDDESRLDASFALSQLDLDEKAVDRVITLLKSKTARPQAITVLAAAGRKSPKAVAALMKEYTTGKDDDREMIGASLGSAGKLAVPALIQLAEDNARNDSLRIGALISLGRLYREGAEAAPKLVGLLKSPNKSIQTRAAIALAQTSADPAAVPVLLEALSTDDDMIFEETCRALNTLGPKGAPAADRLIERLKTAKEEKRYTLAMALAAVTRGTDKGVPTLLALLRNDAEERDRQFGVDAIQSVGKPAVPSLIRALTDGQYSRPQVIQALRGFDDDEAGEAGPALAKMLGDKDRTVAIAAAEALAQIDPKQEAAVPVLIEAVKSADIEKRHAAINAIGQFGKAARPALPVLIEALKEPAIRGTAAYALARLGPDAAEAVDPLIRMLTTREGPAAANALAAIGPKAVSAVPALIKLLDRESTIHWAAPALGKLGDAKIVVPIILKKLDSDDQRLAALHALSSMPGLNPEIVLPELLKRTNDTDPECRTAVIHALGTMKSPKTVPALLKALDDPETEVRLAAVGVIGQAGQDAAPAVPVLINFLKGKDDFLRHAAANALGRLGATAEPAIPVLMEALDDKSIRNSAAYALGNIGPKAGAASPRLIAMLDEQEFRYPAIHALSQFGPAAKEALPKLRKLLENSPEDGERMIKEAILKIEGKK